MRWPGSFPMRPETLMLFLPPLLLALQLLIIGSRLPRVARAWGRVRGERHRAVAFSVISIGPGESARQRGTATARPVVQLEWGHASDGARLYEEENERHERQAVPRELAVQPWAADPPSFTAEVDRILSFITTPQVNCSSVLSPGRLQAAQALSDSPHWLLCAEHWLLPAADAPCVAYSFSMNGGDAHFVDTVSRLGCEVHSFNPSYPGASAGYPGNSLAGTRVDRGSVSKHKMWLEWRAPKRRRRKARGKPGAVSQTLSDIMEVLGHRTVHFLYADLLSAEWRVFQSWIESGTLQDVRHLIATVHLHWAGFEVGGTNEQVLRYWFSVLRGFQECGLKLVHSSPGEGHDVLRQTVPNAHSSYTLSWVNTQH